MFKRTLVSPVSASSTYNDTQKIEFGFMAHRISLHYRSGTNPVNFSINGSDTTVQLGDDTNLIQSYEIVEPTTELWYMGGAGDEVIEIMASASY